MISALIVVYNKKIDESTTYKCIPKNKINLIVYDNSNSDYIEYNKEYAIKNKLAYYTENKNVGLSKAYNYVIDKISHNDDYLIILDDDTMLNNDYFDELFEITKFKKYDIILPVIKANNTIISPAKVEKNGRIKVLNSIDEINLNQISAINSAMIVKCSVFDKVKYNENMFLDYVDHDFMNKIREMKLKIYIMKTEIKQNFSYFNKNNLISEIHRFKIFKKDYKIYCKNNSDMGFYYISILKFRLHYFIKYKSLKFLWV